MKKKYLKFVDDYDEELSSQSSNDDEYVNQVSVPDPTKLQIAQKLNKHLDISDTASVSSEEEDTSIKLQNNTEHVSFKFLKFKKGHKRSPTCLFLSDESCFTAGKDCCIIKWDLETMEKQIYPGRPKQTNQGHTDSINSMIISQDNKFIITAGEDKTIRFFDTNLPSPPFHTCNAHVKPINCLSWIDNGPKYISADINGEMKIWDIRQVHYIDIWRGHDGPITNINRLNSNLLSCGNDATVRLWNVSLYI